MEAKLYARQLFARLERHIRETRKHLGVLRRYPDRVCFGIMMNNFCAYLA
jgi:ferritin-like metal-binding protein YciE